jgi:hypothetical protein
MEDFSSFVLKKLVILRLSKTLGGCGTKNSSMKRWKKLRICHSEHSKTIVDEAYKIIERTKLILVEHLRHVKYSVFI